MTDKEIIKKPPKKAKGLNATFKLISHLQIPSYSYFIRLCGTVFD
jgi:hypothetical protein